MTSEANEHTYGCWRVIQSDFTLEQLIGIVDKSKIRSDAIYSSGLVTARGNSTLKGYLSTFREFVENLKSAAAKKPPGGPVNVDVNEKAVDQLWDEVQGVINAVNAWMIPFLGIFGIEEGNGLTPLTATKFNRPGDLSAFINDYFKPPPKDSRDSLSHTNLEDDERYEDTHSDYGDTDPQLVLKSDDDNVVTAFNTFVASTSKIVDKNEPDVDMESDDDQDSDLDAIPLEQLDATSFFADGGNEDNCILVAIKEMLSSSCPEDVRKTCLKVMELLDLGRLEKGSLLFDTKQKSFQQRWMGSKVRRNPMKPVGDVDQGGKEVEDEIFIERDTLIQLYCNRGGAVTVENYRVLCPFAKYYNKWYISVNKTKFVWNKKSNNVRFLVRMMKKSGSSYEEVKLEKNGLYGPRCIFRICSMSDILGVVTSLVDF
jgi:hypothetical protein